MPETPLMSTLRPTTLMAQPSRFTATAHLPEIMVAPTATTNAISAVVENNLASVLGNSSGLIGALGASPVAAFTPNTSTPITSKPEVGLENIKIDASLAHVLPMEKIYKDHLNLALPALREALDKDEDEHSLKSQVKAFIEKWGDDQDVKSILKSFIENAAEPTASFKWFKRREMLPDSSAGNVSDEEKHTHFSTRMFDLGSVASNDFRQTKSLDYALQRLYKRKQKSLTQQKTKAKELQGQVQNAVRKLTGELQQLQAKNADYQLIKGLIREDWESVDAAYSKRKQILENPLGFVQVRTLDVPLFKSPPERIQLLPALDEGRLSVACQQWKDVDLPDSLLPFIELLMELPISNWRSMQAVIPLLSSAPGWHTYASQGLVKTAVVKNQMKTTTAGRMQSLSAGYGALLQSIQISHHIKYWSETLAEQVKIVADSVPAKGLSDIGVAKLRHARNQLENRLQQGVVCLSQLLANLPGSTRLRWAEAAENNTLIATTPAYWDGFNRSDAATGIIQRQLETTLNALMQELHEKASKEAYEAMNTLIRAILIDSIHDDPTTLIKGKVTRIPPTLVAGAIIGAELNKTPTLNSHLMLLDEAQRVVAKAQVINARNGETDLSITQLYVSEVINPKGLIINSWIQ